MKKIALVNQKGGVAKTTTCVNLAYFLSKRKKILLIDTDPQANLSSVFGMKGNKIKGRTIYECITNNGVISDYIHSSGIENIDIVPADINLADAELQLTSVFNRESVLKKCFSQSKLNYDFIIFDCNPSLGLLTVNVMVATKNIIIPLEACEFSLEGIENLLNIFKMVKEGVNFDLDIMGVLLTRVDIRRNISKDIKKQLADIFEDKVFKTVIHNNVKVSEANRKKKPVGIYSPKCRGAIDYFEFSQEVLNNE